MPVTGSPGQLVTLSLEFRDEASGSLTDPSTVVLDITYGTEVGLVTDTAGPFPWTGATTPSAGVVYRTGTGQFSFQWQVPYGLASGVYVANWSCGFSGDTFLAIENFVITGGSVPVTPGPPSADLGYWTGGLSYGGTDLEFGAVDGSGVAWLLQKVEGWDGPDVTGGVIQRSGDHGGWPSPQFFQPRVITLTLTASAPSQALRDGARNTLSSVVPVSDLAVFRYDEPVPKQAQARRAGKITESYLTLTDATFSVLLVAPDPRKYSAQSHTVAANAAAAAGGITVPFTVPFTLPAQPPGGAVVAANAGNFETRPTVVISGPVTSPSLTRVTTGETVSWSGLVLGSGDTLTVDFMDRQALLNGTAYRTADVFSAWWVLGQGSSEIQLGGVTGSGAGLSVTWRDSWI